MENSFALVWYHLSGDSIPGRSNIRAMQRIPGTKPFDEGTLSSVLQINSQLMEIQQRDT